MVLIKQLSAVRNKYLHSIIFLKIKFQKLTSIPALDEANITDFILFLVSTKIQTDCSPLEYPLAKFLKFLIDYSIDNFFNSLK